MGRDPGLRRLQLPQRISAGLQQGLPETAFLACFEVFLLSLLSGILLPVFEMC